jgi:hypothetical protein
MRLGMSPSFEAQARTTNYKYDFALQVRLRGRDRTFYTGGSCREGTSGVLSCFVECDGGSIRVVPRRRDAMMYLDDSISVAECGKNPINGEGEELRSGKDDKTFRLDRIADAECGMVFDQH